MSAKGLDRFAALSWSGTPNGAVFIDEANLYFECQVHDILTAGDHYIVLLEVKAISAHADSSPLVFHRSAFSAIAAG